MFQFLTNNGHLPLLAAYDRFHDAYGPVSYAFELDVFDSNADKSELDVTILEGGRLWLGEATILDRFENSAGEEQQRLERLAEVAAVLDPYGLIFITSAPTFAARTRSRVDSVLGGHWPHLEYCEAVMIEASANA